MLVADIRISPEGEDAGIDRIIHAGTAYDQRQSVMFGMVSRPAAADTRNDRNDRKAAAPALKNALNKADTTTARGAHP